VFPKNIRRLPFALTLEPDSNQTQDQSNATLLKFSTTSAAPVPPAATRWSPSRNIPAARYVDVCGQNEAVEQVRDYAELPLKHPELFQRLGVRPGHLAPWPAG